MVFNDMVPGIDVECVCLSGTMLAKAGTVLDVCLWLRGIDCGRGECVASIHSALSRGLKQIMRHAPPRVWGGTELRNAREMANNDVEVAVPETRKPTPS